MLSALKRVLPNSVIYPVPAPYILKGYCDEFQYTPDYATLQEYQWQLMFVYGQLQRSLRYNGLIKDAGLFKGEAFTKNNYQAFWKDLGLESFPIALVPRDGVYLQEFFGEKGADGEPITYLRGPTAVKGEVWQVRPQQFLTIDKFMDNTILFYRKRIRLQVPTRLVRKRIDKQMIEWDEQKITEIRAWAYIGQEDFWREQVADDFIGSPPKYLLPPLPIHKPHNTITPAYYHFNATNLNGYR